MSQITIRKLDSALESLIRDRAAQEKKSLNEVCTELIEQALGFESGSDKKRNLDGLAGSWTDEDYLDFEKSQEPFARIDEELWK